MLTVHAGAAQPVSTTMLELMTKCCGSYLTCSLPAPSSGSGLMGNSNLFLTNPQEGESLQHPLSAPQTTHHLALSYCSGSISAPNPTKWNEWTSRRDATERGVAENKVTTRPPSIQNGEENRGVPAITTDAEFKMYHQEDFHMLNTQWDGFARFPSSWLRAKPC